MVPVVLLALVAYTVVGHSFEHRVDLMLPVDHWIPFWPWTLVIYYSMYLLFLTAAWFSDRETFVRGIAALLVLSALSFVSFAVLTSHYPRPDPATIESPLWRGMFEALFAADSPANTFPSLHVGCSTIAAMMLTRGRPRFRWFWLWAGAISLSTLTVKQHYVLDVVGGVALAVAVDHASLRVARFLRERDKDPDG